MAENDELVHNDDTDYWECVSCGMGGNGHFTTAHLWAYPNHGMRRFKSDLAKDPLAYIEDGTVPRPDGSETTSVTK